MAGFPPASPTPKRPVNGVENGASSTGNQDIAAQKRAKAAAEKAAPKKDATVNGQAS